MSVSAESVINYLHQLEVQGQTHVNVDDEARLILRDFYINATQKKEVVSAKEPVIDPIKINENTPSNDLKSELIKPIIKGGNAEEKILSLKQQAARWQPARELGTLRQTLVFSTGNPNADIMLVGEAPGFDDERLGEPLVGKAGQKLDGILVAMGLSRDQVYITNLVKFRPSMPNQTASNRKPSVEEIKVCEALFHEELKIVRPKVIIALGVTPAQVLLNSEVSVKELRGQLYDYLGTPLRVTYHPSYILHDGNTPEKRELWEDMLAVMELLQLPISEKQLGYFLKK